MAERTRVSATINGQAVDFLCEPHQSLLECLRDILGLTGAKEGCNDGNCGACSVLLNGRLVNSCLVLGVEIEGHEVTTVEGAGRLARPAPHPAGDCRPGRRCSAAIARPVLLIAAKALLDREPNPSETQIRAWLGGNLCRCTGYDKIVRAVQVAAQPLAEQRQEAGKMSTSERDRVQYTVIGHTSTSL